MPPSLPPPCPHCEGTGQMIIWGHALRCPCSREEAPPSGGASPIEHEEAPGEGEPGPGPLSDDDLDAAILATQDRLDALMAEEARRASAGRWAWLDSLPGLPIRGSAVEGPSGLWVRRAFYPYPTGWIWREVWVSEPTPSTPRRDCAFVLGFDADLEAWGLGQPHNEAIGSHASPGGVLAALEAQLQTAATDPHALCLRIPAAPYVWVQTGLGVWHAPGQVEGPHAGRAACLAELTSTPAGWYWRVGVADQAGPYDSILEALLRAGAELERQVGVARG